MAARRPEPAERRARRAPAPPSTCCVGPLPPTPMPQRPGPASDPTWTALDSACRSEPRWRRSAAAALRPYGAVVAQATGAAYGRRRGKRRPIANAAARVTAPSVPAHANGFACPPPERRAGRSSIASTPLSSLAALARLSRHAGIRGPQHSSSGQCSATCPDYVRPSAPALPTRPLGPRIRRSSRTALISSLPVTLRPDANAGPAASARMPGPNAMVGSGRGTGCVLLEGPKLTRLHQGTVTRHGELFRRTIGPVCHCGWTLPGDALQASYESRAESVARLDPTSGTGQGPPPAAQAVNAHHGPRPCAIGHTASRNSDSTPRQTTLTTGRAARYSRGSRAEEGQRINRGVMLFSTIHVPVPKPAAQPRSRAQP